jgi:hypothetical protein
MESPDPPEVGGGTKTQKMTGNPAWTTEFRETWLMAHAAMAARRSEERVEEAHGRPPEDRPGMFRTTATPIDERIREGRRQHREDELPQARAKGGMTRSNKERRREIAQKVATQAGSVCFFGYACRHGTECRGEHTDEEKVLFRQRDRKVAALERESGCAYCRVGMCKYGDKCRGQRAIGRSSKPNGDPNPPEPRKLIRKRGRRRARGRRTPLKAAPSGVKPEMSDVQEYDKTTGHVSLEGGVK